MGSEGDEVIARGGGCCVRAVDGVRLMATDYCVRAISSVADICDSHSVCYAVCRFVLVKITLFTSVLLMVFSGLLAEPLIGLGSTSGRVTGNGFGVEMGRDRNVASSARVARLSRDFGAVTSCIRSCVRRLGLTTRGHSGFVTSFARRLGAPLASIVNCTSVLHSCRVRPRRHERYTSLVCGRNDQLRTLSLGLLGLVILGGSRVGAMSVEASVVTSSAGGSILFVLGGCNMGLGLGIRGTAIGTRPSLLGALLCGLVSGTYGTDRDKGPIALAKCISDSECHFYIASDNYKVTRSSLTGVARPFCVISGSHSEDVNKTKLKLSVYGRVTGLRNSALRVIDRINGNASVDFAMDLTSGSRRDRSFRSRVWPWGVHGVCRLRSTRLSHDHGHYISPPLLLFNGKRSKFYQGRDQGVWACHQCGCFRQQEVFRAHFGQECHLNSSGRYSRDEGYGRLYRGDSGRSYGFTWERGFVFRCYELRSTIFCV